MLVNQSPHQLDLLQWFMGEIDEISGYWANLNHPTIEVEDTALAMIRFKNGGLGSIVTSLSQKPGIYTKVHVHGSSGASVGVETDRGATFVAGMSEIAEPPLNDLWTIPGEEHLLAEFQAEDRARFGRINAHQPLSHAADPGLLAGRPRRPAADGYRRRRPYRRGDVHRHLSLTARLPSDQVSAGRGRVGEDGGADRPRKEYRSCRQGKGPGGIVSFVLLDSRRSPAAPGRRMKEVSSRPVPEGPMTSTLLRGRPLFLFLPLLAGCAAQPTRVESYAPPTPARGIVLVAEGAGGYQNAPRAITGAVDALHLPLYVRSIGWTHGVGFGLADVVDAPYAHCQGRLLADEIGRYRTTCPGVPVYLVGYSAGAAVALAAGEWLPPDSIERIVLLAPAVSADYDLRCPLASARCGIDVFFSTNDRWWLGLGSAIVGTADGKRDAPAGRVGFRCPGDAALAHRLHQHPWDTNVAWTGNDGGHTGSSPRLSDCLRHAAAHASQRGALTRRAA